MVPAEDRRYFVRRLLAWARAEGRTFPWREETDPFRVLIAEILLQRSRGTTVAGVYRQLFRRWKTPRSLARAEVAHIEEVIRPLGLTRRAATLKRLAKEMVDLGALPSTMEGLMALPGVGRYAASATLAVLGKRSPAVDGTSARVYRRYFGLSAERDGQVDDELWALVEETSPRRPSPGWNHAVLDLASAICLPKVPRCPDCPLKARCVVGRARIRNSVAPIG